MPRAICSNKKKSDNDKLYVKQNNKYDVKIQPFHISEFVDPIL